MIYVSVYGQEHAYKMLGENGWKTIKKYSANVC